MEVPNRQIIAYPPRLMAAAEAARYLGIGQTTLRNHGPQPVALGTRRLYDINALNRWADRLTGQPLDDIAEIMAILGNRTHQMAVKYSTQRQRAGAAMLKMEAHTK